VSDFGLSSQKLNLTLALCAVLISAASFYATYLQANAAEKQVKAMTLPLLQYGTSNYDIDTKEPVLKFVIKNSGVGPALIKSLSFKYKDHDYQDFNGFLKACCSTEVETMLSGMKENNLENAKAMSRGGQLTSTAVNTILPGQEEIGFFQLYPGSASNILWKKLDIERRGLAAVICYCSLLDECYSTEKRGVVKAVKACSVEQ